MISRKKRGNKFVKRKGDSDSVDGISFYGDRDHRRRNRNYGKVAEFELYAACGSDSRRDRRIPSADRLSAASWPEWQQNGALLLSGGSVFDAGWRARGSFQRRHVLEKPSGRQRHERLLLRDRPEKFKLKSIADTLVFVLPTWRRRSGLCLSGWEYCWRSFWRDGLLDRATHVVKEITVS